MAEGYIKFDCRLIQSEQEIPKSLFEELNAWRNRLFELNLLGADEQGIGFGNISVRGEGTNQFYITGSATGRFRHAEPQHYVLVTEYSFMNNRVTCMGSVRASSESLSHAAVYEADERIRSVIHIHHGPMWEAGLNRMATTDSAFSFGTPEIALNIAGLLRNERIRESGILIMGGHPEGILFFGNSPGDAGQRVLDYLKEVAHD